MSKPNTDKEMLELCLEAFRSGVSAKAALKFLKTRCGKTDFPPYYGSGQDKLRREMIGRLEFHLDLEQTF